MSLIKLLGYMPDADPTIVGVLTNVSAMIPTLKGMKGAPTPASSGVSVLAGTCQGAIVLTKLDETHRVFAGTGTKLYEANASAFTDVSRATAYTAGADVRWRFAQFGNVSLAANKSDTIQSSSSTAFSDITGAPKAGIIETVNQFVFAFNTNEATYGDSPDRWWCCALGDQTDWTPAIATQSATGRLLNSPGRIRAGRRFGDNIVAYKLRAMFLGVYVGPPVIWDWQQLPGESGALCHEVVVNVGTPEDPRHIFMGYEDFYSFDGGRPIPIGSNRIKETVFASLRRNRAEQSYAMHDKGNSLVYFYYPVADSNAPDKCVVYNYRTGQWGVDDRQIQAALEYVAAGLSYGNLGGQHTTYGDLPSLSYGTFLSTNTPVPAIFDTANTLKLLNGAAGTSSLTTGDLGDDEKFSLLTRVKCRYITAPSSASLVNKYRNNIGDALTTDVTTAEDGGKFDVLREARWHRLQLEFTGAVELSGLVPELEEAGLE